MIAVPLRRGRPVSRPSKSQATNTQPVRAPADARVQQCVERRFRTSSALWVATRPSSRGERTSIYSQSKAIANQASGYVPTLLAYSYYETWHQGRAEYRWSQSTSQERRAPALNGCSFRQAHPVTRRQRAHVVSPDICLKTSDSAC